MSKVQFKPTSLNPLGRLIILVFRHLGILHVTEGLGEEKDMWEVNNFTLINLVLRFLGPLHESTLAIILLFIQVNILYF